MLQSKSRAPSLTTLCEINLMRNHLLIQDVANVPYRLIRNILLKLKRDHLCKLEASNPLLIFEDDEVWIRLLNKDFPLHVHESYTSRKEEIYDFYLSFVEGHQPALFQDEGLLRSHLNSAVRKDFTSQKYKIPPRMLYFKYQEDLIRKQEQSEQRLRLRMKKIKKEQEKKQIVHLEDPLYMEKKTRTQKNTLGNRSNLFTRSLKEHQKRQQHFKSGGYDVTKRPMKRLAFGGQVGATCAPNTHPSPPTETHPPLSPNATHPPPVAKPPPNPVKKRKPNEPNIFLKRRKPLPIVRNKSKTTSTPAPAPPESKKKKDPVVVKVASTKVSKKKSSIFSPPSAQQQESQAPESPRKVYIFDGSGTK